MVDAIILGGYSIVESSTKSAGMIIVANLFRQQGFTAQIIDHLLSIPKDKLSLILQRYVDSNTKFVCLSTTLLGPPGQVWTNMQDIDDLFEPIFLELQQLAPHAKFIIGGSLIKLGQQSRLPWDYTLVGQGETALRAVIAHTLYGDTLELDPEGRVSDRIYDYQNFSHDTLLTVSEHEGIGRNETLPMEIARGCVFKCAYCNYDLLGKQFGDYTKTLDTVVKIMQQNYEQFGTTRYIFADETINDSEAKINLLMRIREQLSFELEFAGYFRLELFEKHPHSIQQFLDAGLRGVNLGLETLNRQAGQTVGKGYGTRAWDTLAECRSIWRDQVIVQANFILGLPYDTEHSLESQHEQLVQSTLIDYAHYNPLYIGLAGDSAFTQGMWQRYYTSIAEDMSTAQDREQLEQQRPGALAELVNQVHWRSLTAPELNLYRCHSLTEQFYRDWRQRRPYIINNYESQAVLSLREFYTIPEMRILRLDSEWANIERQRRIKINGYVNFLLYNKHQHLSSGPSPREPVLATRRAHVSRIQFMPSHESQ